MAAATIGAGAVVNADNVQQQSVSSQKTSIAAKVSSESQSVKSGNVVVLKASSQSSAKDSSQNSKKNEANATSAVNTLENDANKSSDVVTQSYAQEAEQWSNIHEWKKI